VRVLWHINSLFLTVDTDADLQVEKMRFEALRCMTRAYRPTLQVSYIGHVLGFIGFSSSEASPVKEQEELDECEEWLRAHGAVLVNDAELIVDCKVCKLSFLAFYLYFHILST
jgi:hypothetical protein